MPTGFQVTPLRRMVMPALMLAAAGQCLAADVEIRVLDEHGGPLAGAVVHAVADPAATATHAATPPAATTHSRAEHAAHTAVMDQRDNEFVPHLLVVETGTSVRFPNSDDVSHHVYSFSEARPFDLALYKGNEHPPLVFDRAGVVVLGCNIHDGMLGYIVVVPTPHHAVTAADGRATLTALPAGRYSIHAYTPRARAKGLPAAYVIDLADGPAASVTLTVAGRLAPSRSGDSGSLSWHRY